ncbi:hypothetical protein [Geodermatophilus amargosae]|nr:hypothetical protein [Geodermatophilus amargosae]
MENWDAIRLEADRHGISPYLLGAVIAHEGTGRESFISTFGSLGRTVERSRLGRDTVGIGQMEPQLAAGYAGISVDEARRQLVDDNSFAIKMVARHLQELKARYELSDSEAFVAYAFSLEATESMRAVDFDPQRVAPDDRQDVIDRSARFRSLHEQLLKWRPVA